VTQHEPEHADPHNEHHGSQDQNKRLMRWWLAVVHLERASRAET